MKEFSESGFSNRVTEYRSWIEILCGNFVTSCDTSLAGHRLSRKVRAASLRLRKFGQVELLQLQLYNNFNYKDLCSSSFVVVERLLLTTDDLCSNSLIGKFLFTYSIQLLLLVTVEKTRTNKKRPGIAL